MLPGRTVATCYIPQPGPLTVGLTVTDRATGVQLSNGVVAPYNGTTYIDFHEWGTAYGSCAIYVYGTPPACSYLVQTQTRDVNHLGTNLYANSKVLSGNYFLGDVFGKNSNGTTAYFQSLDDSMSNSTGPIEPLNITAPGIYTLTLTTQTDPTVCPVLPESISTQMTVFYEPPIDKNLGCQTDGKDGQKQVADPCDVSTGNNYQKERDYQSATLPLERHYNSLLHVSLGLGIGWTTAYHRRLELFGSNMLSVRRVDGRAEPFTLSGEVWQGQADSALTVTQDSTGFTVIVENGDSERYDLTGRIQSVTRPSGMVWTWTYDPTTNWVSSVTDSFGNALTFQYGSNALLQTVVLPDGSEIQYTYDSNLNLTSVTYPDNTSRQYLYQNTAAGTVNQLTGIKDESGVQFATFAYNSNGQVSSSQHAGGVDSVGLTYSTGSTTSVTDAFGVARTYTYQAILGKNKTTSISGTTCLQCGGASAVGYDANGNPTSRTDFKGVQTIYGYDTTRNLETSRTEANGTSQSRTITTQWHPTWRLPTLVTESSRTTAYGYDSNANLLTKTVADTTVTPNVSRTWTYSYNSHGQMLTAKGPRTDVNSTTTYTYYTCTSGYQCGHLQTVTDPVGNVTTYNSYNAHGQPLTISDPNGVVTTLGYDARQRLTSRQVGSEVTTFSYYPTGLLKQVTLPDSSYVLYTYDNAHRLTQISDGAGNSIQYTLDAMGNRTADKTYDPSGTLHRTHTRVYNALNELYQDVNAAGTSAVTTTYTYDNNGNQTGANAPLSRNTANQYDPLNRLTQITDPNSGNTYFGYDAEDNLTSVEDPRSLTTTYGYNGFGDLANQASPDTGTTTNTYDSGGNLSTSTDARNAVSAYTYDAANRVTSIAYTLQSVTDQTIVFAYDSGANGKGRLTSASDANHSLSWSYDFAGRVVGKGLTIGTVNLSVGYGYTSGDRTALVTPSGQSVTYGFNGNHQITSLAVNGTTVLSGVTYEPFGGVNGWTWGDGSTTSRAFNGDGLVSQIVTAGVTLGYSYDNGNRIGGITDSSNSAVSWTYGYDLLDRLTSATTSTITDGWTYDPNGNQLTQTGSTPITFSLNPANNQLSTTSGSLIRSYSYDAAGHTESYGTQAFIYNNRGRLEATSASSTNYLYNVLGQIIEKSGALGTTIFMQDEPGHLIGEYDGSGNLVEETVWLGDIPVATLQPNGSGGVNIYYVHTDHLNSARKVAQPGSGQLVWRWDADPFGTAAPNQNPAGLGTFAYNLRFPGQYYMTETGLNQNVSRDYDPLVARYVESDPIGLNGGSYSTYIYVGDTPLLASDPTGLKARVCCRKIPYLRALGIVHCFIDTDFGGQWAVHGDWDDPDAASGEGFIRNNNPFDDPASKDTKCGPWNEDCNTDDCVKKAIAGYSNPSAYSAVWGPNSNTFASTVASKCGLKKPSFGWARGWGQSPAPTYRPPESTSGGGK